MSYILRSSTFIRQRKKTRQVEAAKALPKSIDGHDFFYDDNTCASITANWTEPKHSLGRLIQLGGVEGLSKALRTDLSGGLYADEVAGANFKRRIAIYGQNTFKKRKIRNFFLLCIDELKDPILIVLLLAAFLSIIISVVPFGDGNEEDKHSYIEGLAIIVTVLIVVLVAAGNNYSKELQFRSLDDKKDIKKVVVVRDKKESEVLNTEVMVGDIVVLSTGVSIPCDGVLINGTEDLMCEESALTGESRSICKSWEQPFLLAGTQVVNGEGVMISTSVGVRTCWGALLEGLSDKREKTPLEKKLLKTVKALGICGTITAILMFIVKTTYWIYGNLPNPFKKATGDFIMNLVTSVTLIVVAIPEGLPLAVTISLAYSMKKMYKDNNFVRVLAACETMGNATTICSDKTGTLTQNQMTIVEVWPNAFLHEKGSSSPVFDSTPPCKEYRSVLLEGIALNSKVFVTDQSQWKDPKKPEYCGGNKTECAMFAWGRKLGCDDKLLRKRFLIEKAYPFSSVTKRSSVLVKHVNGRYRMYLKGAAEKVISEFCSAVITPEGEIEQLTDANKVELMNVIDAFVSRGLRCICLAYRDYEQIDFKAGEDQIPNDPEFNDFICIAVTALKDPVRIDVPAAMRRCQEAGIVVRMVTGDHPKTAEFIADECGIRPKGSKDLLVMTGDQFRVLSEKQMQTLLPQLRVLARSTPQDKEKLVRWYMAHNETVAVTGDGANDALALKEANVGLSMGIQGTDVAKEASDIIILDDSFASIVETVKWGRSIYDNICKFVQFQLTINIVALIVSFIGAVAVKTKIKNYPLPFTPVQLLWMNIIMDTGAALAYSTEEPTDGLLKRRPYRKDSMLISYTMWKCILGQACLQIALILIFVFPVENPLGFSIFQIGSVDKDRYLKLSGCVFNTFVWFQIFNSINARRINDELNVLGKIFKNFWFPSIFAGIIVMQVVIITFLGKIANVTPLDYKQWLICIAFGASSLPAGFILRSIPFKRNYGFVEQEKTHSVKEKILPPKKRSKKLDNEL